MKTTEKQQSLDGLENVEKKSSSKLISIEKIDGTPFHITTNEELEESHLCLGNYRLTGEPLSKDDCKKKAKKIDWELILQIVEIAIKTLVKKESINEILEEDEYKG